MPGAVQSKPLQSKPGHGRLLLRGKPPQGKPSWLDVRFPALRSFLVGRVYANHNHSPAVRRVLADLLAELERSGEWGLDAGAGQKKMHSRVLAIDLSPNATVDGLASAEALPFRTASLGLVVSQEVVEHLADPWGAVAEAARVLKPGGRLYLQAPFVIGYHASPRDYWRFTGEGLEQLLASAGLQIERLEPAVGAGSGMYRIAVEFWAALAAAAWPRLYLPVKALGVILLRPLCFVDRLIAASPAAHRIPGGYFAVAVKPS
jgi:SAM-dependent methyltransferase